MGFYDSYRKIMQCGESESDKILDEVCQTIKDNFYSMPNVYTIYKNDVPSTTFDVIIEEGTKNKDIVGYKSLLSYPYDSPQFVNGDYIYWTYGGNDTIWILSSIDLQASCQIKGRMYQCNTTFKIQTSVTEVKTGEDSLGRPITTKTPVYYEQPALRTTRQTVTTDSDLGNAINLPQGYINIMTQYDGDSDKQIKIGQTFALDGKNYIVTNVNIDGVIDSVGHIILLAKEVTLDENA